MEELEKENRALRDIVQKYLAEIEKLKGLPPPKKSLWQRFKDWWKKKSWAVILSNGGGLVSTVKEKLIKIIQDLDDDTAKKLLEEIDDILLQLELENDSEFMETVRRIESGEEELIPHEEVKKKYKLWSIGQNVH